MTKGELKAYFRGVLNRRDLTDVQAEFYIQSALTRLGRSLRTPGMEFLQELTVDADGQIELPIYFLEHKDAWVTGQPSLNYIPIASFRRLVPYSGTPEKYTRVADKYLLYPTPAAGSTVWLHCYIDAQPLVVEADENIFTNTAPDLLMYAACAEACAFFVDDRMSTFESLYVQRLDELILQSRETDLAGGSMAVELSTTQEI